MRPVCEITINGAPVSGLFSRRLISCEVSDREGLSSDTMRVTLHDDPPAKIPDVGDTMACRMGYGGGLVDMGEYVIDGVEVRALPGEMTLTGKAADLTGKVKESKDRHWDDTSIKTIVTDLASELDLKAKVDDQVGAFVYEWIGMLGESPLHFLERLAGRHGALFSIKGRTLIFASRGTGQAPGGAALTATTLAAGMIAPGTLAFSRSSRSDYESVVAKWINRETSRENTVRITTKGRNTGGEYKIGSRFGSESEARAAAQAKSDELQRSTFEFRCQIIGQPTARAGAPVIFVGCRVGIDGREFILSEATHSFSKSGYTTSLAGYLKTDSLGVRPE